MKSLMLVRSNVATIGPDLKTRGEAIDLSGRLATGRATLQRRTVRGAVVEIVYCGM
ncbi:MAG: hypothetical protein QGG42_18185 [Phycisphaerae bacterium]|nr:hypothetical protein [Phycisphaerae bacterium]